METKQKPLKGHFSALNPPKSMDETTLFKNLLFISMSNKKKFTYSYSFFYFSYKHISFSLF
jgi:hypothetical protein